MCNKLSDTKAYSIALSEAKKVVNSGWFKGKRINYRELAKVGFTLMEIESELKPCAKNPNSTATGILQVTEATRREMESKYLKVRTTSQTALRNANYGTFIGLANLAYQFLRYGSWHEAIIAYNQGNAGEKARSRANTYVQKYNRAFSNNDYALLDSQTNRDISYNNVEFP